MITRELADYTDDELAVAATTLESIYRPHSPYYEMAQRELQNVKGEQWRRRGVPVTP